MHSLLYPVCNEREAMRRQGLKPKDHARENVRRIKEMQMQKAQVCASFFGVHVRTAQQRVSCACCRQASCLWSCAPVLCCMLG